MNQQNHAASDSREPEAWGECEAGLMTGLARRRQAAVAQARQTKIVGGTLIAAAAVLLLAFTLTNRGDQQPEVWGPVYGGIACSQCLDMMPAYNDHLVGNQPMSASQVESMEVHFANCPKCVNHFKMEFPGVLPAAMMGLTGFFVLRRGTEVAS